MTSQIDPTKSYKTYYTKTYLDSVDAAIYPFLVTKGYSNGSETIVAGEYLDGVLLVANQTEPDVVIDAAGDPVCFWGLNGCGGVTPAIAVEDANGNITVLNGNGNIPLATTGNAGYVAAGKLVIPGALAHTLSGTVDNSNKVVVHNAPTLFSNAFVTPPVLTNSTGEKRLFAIATTATADLDTNAGVTADTVTTLALTSTVPFVDGTTTSAIGRDNEVKSGPTSLNADSFRASNTSFIILNNGQSTNINISVSWFYTALVGSTANTNGRAGYANFQVTSYPAE